MNLPRSTLYYRPAASEVGPTDVEIAAIVEDIQDEFPVYGYRRVTHELRRRGLLVNHKKVARIMRLAGLGIRPRKRYVRTTDSRHDNPIHPNLYRNNIPSCLDQVWVADCQRRCNIRPRGGVKSGHAAVTGAMARALTR